ncbi:MAG: FtsX-like permease family protein, partial [Planctomycetes bacterium]|nr:FtsX-like permease family protein [Planctomycetota bacterium]
LLDIRGAHIFTVSANGGATPELTERLRAFAGQNGLSVESMADFQAMVDESMSGVVGSLWMLMALMFIVASFGVVNTLTINVIEQTREIGVLRAVAMTRRQIRRMVLSQALAMGAVSLVPGLIGGITLAGMMQITGPKLNGYPIEFHLEWSLLIGCVVVAIAVAAAASLLPARRAARMRIIGALQYE